MKGTLQRTLVPLQSPLLLPALMLAANKSRRCSVNNAYNRNMYAPLDITHSAAALLLPTPYSEMEGPGKQYPIQVRKATRTDIDDLVRINEEAFGPGVVNKLMYANGMSAAAKKELAAVLAAAIDVTGTAAADGTAVPKPYEEAVVLVEALPGGHESNAKVIAWARYTIRREQQPEEEWKVVEPASAYAVEGANNEVMEAFMGHIRDMRRRNMRGDPGIGLRSLVCSPGWSRMGAGSALLRHGAELADREGLPIWVEASPIGYRLYRRFGFEDVEVFDLDVSNWGAVRAHDENWGAQSAVELAGLPADGVYRSVGMRRLPTKA